MIEKIKDMNEFMQEYIEKVSFFDLSDYKTYLFSINKGNFNDYFIKTLNGNVILATLGKNINNMFDGNFDIMEIYKDTNEEFSDPENNLQIDLFIVLKKEKFFKFFTIIHADSKLNLKVADSEALGEEWNRQGLKLNKKSKPVGIICTNGYPSKTEKEGLLYIDAFSNVTFSEMFKHDPIGKELAIKDSIREVIEMLDLEPESETSKSIKEDITNHFDNIRYYSALLLDTNKNQYEFNGNGTSFLFLNALKIDDQNKTVTNIITNEVISQEEFSQITNEAAEVDELLLSDMLDDNKKTIN